MKTIELKPVRDTPEDYDRIEKRILKILREKLYIPLLREANLPQNKLSNDKSALTKALEMGSVVFHWGTFSGQFNAQISKELKDLGATWVKGKAVFKLRQDQIPPDLLQAIQASELRFQMRMSRIDRKLSQILPEEIAEQIKSAELFDSLLWKVDKELQKTVENISVPPVLTEDRRAKLSEEYQQNMDKYIKTFTENQIMELRQTVMDSAFSGNRYEFLMDGIQRSYGVTRRKARFLARQETNLLIAKFKEARYQEAGVYSYRWKCVAGTKLHPVRPAHKALNGKICRFDDPPITTEPGEAVRRNNPGEDFNCRCIAIPQVTF